MAGPGRPGRYRAGRADRHLGSSGSSCHPGNGRKPMTIRTNIGYATTQDIFVRGKNLSTDIIPNADFVDMACLCILGRYPEPRFKRMMNVILVTSCDHGFTPISMAGRLTFLGAPESLQGAV